MFHFECTYVAWTRLEPILIRLVRSVNNLAALAATGRRRWRLVPLLVRERACWRWCAVAHRHAVRDEGAVLWRRWRGDVHTVCHVVTGCGRQQHDATWFVLLKFTKLVIIGKVGNIIKVKSLLNRVCLIATPMCLAPQFFRTNNYHGFKVCTLSLTERRRSSPLLEQRAPRTRAPRLQATRI